MSALDTIITLQNEFDILMDSITKACAVAGTLRAEEFFVVGHYFTPDQTRVVYVGKGAVRPLTPYTPKHALSGNDRLQWVDATRKLITELALVKVHHTGNIYIKPFIADEDAVLHMTWTQIKVGTNLTTHIDASRLWLDINSLVRVE